MAQSGVWSGSPAVPYVAHAKSTSRSANQQRYRLNLGQGQQLGPVMGSRRMASAASVSPPVSPTCVNSSHAHANPPRWAAEPVPQTGRRAFQPSRLQTPSRPARRHVAVSHAPAPPVDTRQAAKAALSSVPLTYSFFAGIGLSRTSYLELTKRYDVCKALYRGVNSTVISAVAVTRPASEAKHATKNSVSGPALSRSSTPSESSDSESDTGRLSSTRAKAPSRAQRATPSSSLKPRRTQPDGGARANPICAVKIVRKQSLKDANARTAIAREVSLLARMNHGNLVRFVEAFETDDAVFIVTEYCRWDLFNYVGATKRGLSERESLVIVRQLLEVLDYLHHHRVAHRDVKLENIMLCRRSDCDDSLLHATSSVSDDEDVDESVSSTSECSRPVSPSVDAVNSATRRGGTGTAMHTSPTSSPERQPQRDVLKPWKRQDPDISSSSFSDTDDEPGSGGLEYRGAARPSSGPGSRRIGDSSPSGCASTTQPTAQRSRAFCCGTGCDATTPYVAPAQRPPASSARVGDPVLKLADFGLAYWRAPDAVGNTTTQRSGTPHYAAPEVLAPSGEGHVPEDTDVWSTGVVLFALLSRKLPFHGRSFTELKRVTLRLDIRHTVEQLGLTAETEKVVIALLTRNPKRRPSCREAMRLVDAALLTCSERMP